MKKITVSKKSVVKVLMIVLIAVLSFVISKTAGREEKSSISITQTEQEGTDEKDGTLASQEESDSEESSEEVKLLGVHVSGAVRNPDQVWFLPEGSRIADAIEAAGGALKTADLKRLNLAAYLADSMRIYVPFLEDESDPYTGMEGFVTMGGSDAEGSGSEKNTSMNLGEADLTNINLATKIELMTLPGIGETYADRIIRYREENGPFQSIEEIMKVEGIGEKKFEQLKYYITV